MVSPVLVKILKNDALRLCARNHNILWFGARQDPNSSYLDGGVNKKVRTRFFKRGDAGFAGGRCMHRDVRVRNSGWML